jgi:NhaP-type Na+/H+ or K+/H+ antiporter
VTGTATDCTAVLDIVLVVAVFAAALVVVALSEPLAARLMLAPVVFLAVIGVSISAASGVLLRMPLPHWFGGIERPLADLPLGSETFIYVFLPLPVFEAALASEVRRIFEDAAPILVLAVIKTLAAAVVVGRRTRFPPDHSWIHHHRFAEGTLTVALAYLSFIAADRLLQVSGVVAVLAAGMTVRAFGQTRIKPYNW